MENLNLKEQMAIEFKYLGHSYPDISTRIDTPVSTIAGWFEVGGKLYEIYAKYQGELNEKRKKDMEKRIFMSDEEFFLVSTNTIRKYSQLHLTDRKVPLRNRKTGDIAYDKDGNPIMVDHTPPIKFADVKRAWEMQRVMRGLPTAYEKQDIQQTNFEADLIIKELGLVDIDFDDEHREATNKRILDYLESK